MLLLRDCFSYHIRVFFVWYFFERWSAEEQKVVEIKCNNRAKERSLGDYIHVISRKTGSTVRKYGINSRLGVSIREILFVCDREEIIELWDIRILFKCPILEPVGTTRYIDIPTSPDISRGVKSRFNFRKSNTVLRVWNFCPVVP